MNEIQMCTRCIMSANYPGLKFNDEGLCEFCYTDNAEKIDWDQKRNELDARIEKIKAKATRYHAVVPWSGGKDSTYVLWVLTKIYGLKVLAVNVDNGFKSETAYKNLSSISKQLGIDLITLTPDWHLMRDLYAFYLKEKGELCSVCNVMGYVIMGSFILREVPTLGYFPLVVGGWSGMHENVRSIFTFDFKAFRSTIEKNKTLLERFWENSLVSRDACDILETVGDPREINKHGAATDDIRDAFFQLPDYLEWDVTKIKAVLKKELDWYASDSPIAAHEDCNWHNCMKYLMLKKYGIDNDTISFATLVRSGDLSREAALKVARQINSDKQPDEMKSLLSTLGCSMDSINWDSQWYTGDNR